MDLKSNLSEISLNALHEKLNYWVSISWEWTASPHHHAHKMVEEIKKEIRSRGVKVDTYTRRAG